MKIILTIPLLYASACAAMYNHHTLQHTQHVHEPHYVALPQIHHIIIDMSAVEEKKEMITDLPLPRECWQRIIGFTPLYSPAWHYLAHYFGIKYETILKPWQNTVKNMPCLRQPI